MNRRPFLFWLVLVALLLAPFGRMAAAEAMARPHQPAAATAGHCSDMPSDRGKGDRPHKAQIDCLSACAAMATLESPFIPGFVCSASPLVAGIALPFAGLHPQSDPPPPRRS